MDTLICLRCYLKFFNIDYQHQLGIRILCNCFSLEFSVFRQIWTWKKNETQSFIYSKKCMRINYRRSSPLDSIAQEDFMSLVFFSHFLFINVLQIISHAGMLQNRAILLIHFSARYRVEVRSSYPQADEILHSHWLIYRKFLSVWFETCYQFETTSHTLLVFMIFRRFKKPWLHCRLP